jgi:hypothetical protein
MSLILKGIQANKFFGGEDGTWYCRVKGCKLIATVEELKHIDSIGELPWANVGNDTPALISPLCPIHGVLLDFNVSSELVRTFLKENNKTQLALPRPRTEFIHPHHPLEVCSL